MLATINWGGYGSCFILGGNERRKKEMSDNSDKEKAFVLEKQLHKQYATNAQANTGNFIAFLVAILAMFYAFGYVYVFNTNDFANGNDLFVEKEGEHIRFTMDVLLFIASVSLLMLTFLIAYCMNLGWQQRRDHIVITRIRERRMSDEERIGVFDGQYSPYGKGFFKFIPNVYRYYLYLFIIAVVLIILMTLNKTCSVIQVCSFWLFLGCMLCVVSVTLFVWICTFHEYKSFCNRKK